jgi:glutathione synthase/RimK-type ligase-like ATP-grasp enzyme
MKILIVVNNPDRWPLHIPNVELVSARAYLTDPSHSERRGVRVFNLCRSYAYQSLGYYVSLLAEARGHKPQPSVETIQGMKSQATLRLFSEDIAELTEQAFTQVTSSEYVLSIYFGRPLAKRHERLALALFNQYPAPLLRARFHRDQDGTWNLVGMRPIPANEVPESHRPVLVEAAEHYFQGKRFTPRRPRSRRFDLAILVDPQEEHPPSNRRALERFEQAAHRAGLEAERITRDDYARLSEFDALFIRTTTAVEHYTYRFATRAALSGLVVIDDPQSIVRAANKVFLAEVLERHGVRIPRTEIVHRGNMQEIQGRLGLPCVLKKPDSAFSQGVVKVATPEQLADKLEELLEQSELVVAQSFVPTEYDWRVGVLDGRPLYACRYFMAPGHWQVIKHDGAETDYGKVETLPVEVAPRNVIQAAVKAADLIGDGLYGVDLKQHGRDVFVIEVNDNPNIDAGFEDRVLKNELYDRIMAAFVARIEDRKAPYRRRRGTGVLR